MSVRDQERREREAMRHSDKVASRIERRMQGAARQANEATLRAEEVERRIEVGDVVPRPLPSLREDSMESMESMKSSKSIESMKSMESADWWDKKKRNVSYGEDYGSGDYNKDYNTDNRG
jgi:hypothetical protein